MDQEQNRNRTCSLLGFLLCLAKKYSNYITGLPENPRRECILSFIHSTNIKPLLCIWFIVGINWSVKNVPHPDTNTPDWEIDHQHSKYIAKYIITKCYGKIKEGKGSGKRRQRWSWNFQRESRREFTKVTLTKSCRKLLLSISRERTFQAEEIYVWKC